MNKLYLGIIYQNEKIINHRSLLKVLLNPLLRYFGWCIGTPFDEQTNKIIGIFKIFKTDKSKLKWDKYIFESDMKIVKKRVII